MKKLDQDGFTIVELISMMIVTGIFAGLILFFGVSYWRYSALLEADLDSLVTRLNAGDKLREFVGTSSGLIIQNSIADSHTLNPDPMIVSGLYWNPIHAIPGNKVIGATNTTMPLLYFRRFSVNSSKALIMNGLQPYEDEYVLYLNGTTKELLLRSLSNTSATGNSLKTSCPPTLATTLCPADKVVAGDIASIDMRYFSRTGNAIDWTSSYDALIPSYNGPDFTSVEVVEFGLNITKKPLFQTATATNNSTIVRIALRNN